MRRCESYLASLVVERLSGGLCVGARLGDDHGPIEHPMLTAQHNWYYVSTQPQAVATVGEDHAGRALLEGGHDKIVVDAAISRVFPAG